MKPSNVHTSPEERFFFSYNNETECHESFDQEGTPAVEVLSGWDAYVFVENNDGTVTGRETDFFRMLRGGERVVRIASYINHQYDQPVIPTGQRISEEEFEAVGSPLDEYIPGEDDLLILTPPVLNIGAMEELGVLCSEDGVLLHPARDPLPRPGEAGDDPQSLIGYRFHGIITPEPKLVIWAHGVGGEPTPRLLVDQAVVNEHAQNPAEHAVVRNAFRGFSFTGLLATNPAVKSYLQYFDEQRGTTYTPVTDP